ncbi:MAG: DUF2026 family protein [Prosthecobacter sp.]
MSRFLIPRADYQRIFRTIYSVLANETIELTKACVAINTIGASILNKFYGFDARPFAGIAGYCVKPESVILFATKDNGVLKADDGGFHCWIETEDWVVDFTTPLFQKLVEGSAIPDPGSKMMQRKYLSAKQSPQELVSAGDYFIHADIEFTKHALKKFASKQGHHDLINICLNWYQKPPRAMMDSIGIGNEKGEVREVKLSRFSVIGEW